MRRLLGTTLLCLAPLCAGAADAPYVHMNRTIETLEAGHPVFGLFSGDFSLTNARALARSDLDFVFVDMEHTPFDTETLRAFLLGMQDKQRMLEKGNAQMDVTPLVRIPMNGREQLQFLVKQVLDAGAFGVVFPFVETREEALNAVASMRYPQPRGDAAPEPVGIRGASPGIASWLWGVPDYFTRADVWPLDPDGDLLAVVQIETALGVENIEEIAAVPGVGAIFVGPSDLSISYGVPGQRGHPDMQAALERVLAACKANEVPCGLTTGPDTVEDYLAEGWDFVTIGYWNDAGISPAPAEALATGRQAAGRE
ncbi:MAG: aldolase/citrate lyase family protein [Pseudomonadales bacterium]|jgi:4-hydroxy-2-oxoheptanedioate aldolase|nr:aldolase/citrate lyase family protein [Pseudomonadales bacterium]